MQVRLAYGRTGLEIQVPEGRATIIRPRHRPALPDERAAVIQALEHPIGSPRLRQLVRPDTRVCVTFSDLTRATPNERLIPWLLGFLAYLPPERVVLVNQTGTHRPNTQAELEQLLTRDVVRRYRVLNHDAEDPEGLTTLGQLKDGTPVLLNRHVAEADLRIVTGFIEPHFFAGFSGGPKGLVPGCAGLATIMHNHGPRHIQDPNATFGVTEGNPLWEQLRDLALSAGPSFLLNVALNDRREITGVFAGDLIEAHRRGTEFVRSSAMQPVSRLYEVVLTTNSGYPLDLNLYQGVKGLSAAARIVQPGGTIILAAECSEGVPAGSPFEALLAGASSPQALLEQLTRPGCHRAEQWQAQILAQILAKARVLVHSRLPESVLRSCHLEPCVDLQTAVHTELGRRGPEARVAVLPEGPLTIPCGPGA
jgi:lactate racemase